MAINTTLFTNHSENVLVGTMQAINTESSGLFGLFILLAFYIIVFAVQLRWSTKTAFSTTCFVGVLIAIFLRLLNLIFDPILYGSILLAVIAVVILWATRD